MSRRRLNEPGIKAKQEALAMLSEHLDEIMRRVSADPTSESFNRLANLEEVAPGEVLTVVLDAIEDRISEIKRGWSAHDRQMWIEVGAVVPDEDKS
jgi:hypothetical protein